MISTLIFAARLSSEIIAAYLTMAEHFKMKRVLFSSIVNAFIEGLCSH